MFSVRWFLLCAAARLVGLSWAVLERHKVEAVIAAKFLERRDMFSQHVIVFIRKDGLCPCPDCDAKRAAGIQMEAEVPDFMHAPRM